MRGETHPLFDKVHEMLPDAKLMGRGYLLARCVWHDDRKASLLIYPDGWWRCIGACQNSGRIEKLFEELSSPGVARRAPPEQTFERPPYLSSNPRWIERLVSDSQDRLARNEEYKWYLKLRGVEDRAEPCWLGWYEGWITIPILSREWRVQGVCLRATPPQERLTGMRFTQPPSQAPVLYCPDWHLWESSPAVALVFGLFDALALSSLRLPVVTTTGGSGGFNPEWLDHWRKPVIIIPDAEGDEAGTQKLVARFGWRARVVRLPYDDVLRDPADFLKESNGRKEELTHLLWSHLRSV